MKPQWNVPTVVNENLVNQIPSKRPLILLQLIAKAVMTADDCAGSQKSHEAMSTCLATCAVAEYLFLMFGRPSYFLPGHLAELFLKSKYEVKADSLKLPIDSFQLVMPAGYRLSDGSLLTSIHVVRLCSKLGYKFMDMAIPLILSDLEVEQTLASSPYSSQEKAAVRGYLLGLRENFERSKQLTSSSIFVLPYINGYQLGGISLSADLSTPPEPLNDVTGLSGRKLTFVAACAIKKLVVAALCRYTTRPETVVDYSLPRSERYNHKGEKSQRKIFRFLDPKIVTHHAERPDGPSSYTVKPHVRGFVYATLRDARWYRKNPLKPSEPLRIQEREPTIIHAEQFEASHA